MTAQLTADADCSEQWCEQIAAAQRERNPIRIRGGNSKHFLATESAGTIFDTRGHRGILRYDPTELVMTARSGTPLMEIEAALEAQGQMLPCEPPHFGPEATFGGMVAAGLSGPRRPWAGAVRDFVLGCRLIDGRARQLRFGGEVMKNVAGYDVSRLMAGSFGTLGVLTEISMKVLPKPKQRVTLRLEIGFEQSLQRLQTWAGQPLPISAASHDGEVLRLRLEGGPGSVTEAVAKLGGEAVEDGFWTDLRDHRLSFFQPGLPLWRLSLPPATPWLELPGAVLIDWGGAQRWLRSDADPASLHREAAKARGHAQRYAPGGADSLPSLAPALASLHRRLKNELDPCGIFNRGQLYGL